MQKHTSSFDTANKERTTSGARFCVVNYTDKEERAYFDTVEEAQNFASETNGEILK